MEDIEAVIEAEGEEIGWQSKKSEKKKSKAERAIERKADFIQALEACAMDGAPTVTNMMEYLGLSERTIMSRIKESGYQSKSGQIVKKDVV